VLVFRDRKPEVIRYFPVSDLPEDVEERSILILLCFSLNNEFVLDSYLVPLIYSNLHKTIFDFE